MNLQTNTNEAQGNNEITEVTGVLKAALTLSSDLWDPNDNLTQDCAVMRRLALIDDLEAVKDKMALHQNHVLALTMLDGIMGAQQDNLHLSEVFHKVGEWIG